MSNISNVQMIVESQPKAPQTLHQWQGQKEHKKNKENTNSASLSAWTPSNSWGTFLKWNVPMDFAMLKGFIFLEAFSHWISTVLTHTHVYGNLFHSLLFFHIFTLSVHIILFILVHSGQIAGLKGVLINHKKVNQQGFSA